MLAFARFSSFCLIYADTENESTAGTNQNLTANKSDSERRKDEIMEELLRSADEAGQHRSLTAVASCHSRDHSQLASEDDELAASKYQVDFRRVVLAALLRSVEEARLRSSTEQRAGEERSLRVDRTTAACLFDGGGGCKVATSVDDQLRRAIDEDLHSEGGHRAIVLQGAEGSGRTTAMRRFVELVAAASPDPTPPLVVARRVSWPGRTAVDLLCDVVVQLGAVVDAADTCIHDDDEDDGVPSHLLNRRVDLDSLVRSYANLLRAFSETSRGRLVVAVDGLENVRRGGTVDGGDINWLALPLPLRVHVVSTYLTGPDLDSPPLLTAAVGGRTVRTIDVEGLSEAAVNQVIVDAFRRRRRRPPLDGKLSIVMQLSGTKPRAAYIALLADEFAARSAATPEQMEKPVKQLKNMETIANERFKRAERQYGKSVA